MTDANANTPDGPVVDEDALREFRDAIFMHAEDGEIIPIRMFGPIGGAVSTGIAKVGGPMEPIVEMAQAAADGRGMTFCPPLILSNGGAKASDTSGGVALTVDLDKDPEAGMNRLVQVLGRPTALVESGGVVADTDELKLHVHYRLAAVARTPEELRSLKYLRALAAVYSGGDMTSANYTQPIRWPGSLHTKNPADRRPARMRELNKEVEIDVGKAIAALEEAGATAAKEVEPKAGHSKEALRAPSALVVMGCLISIPNDETVPWDRWSTVGMAIHNATEGSEEGRALFHMWSERNALKYTEVETEERWNHWKTNGGDRVGYPHLRSMAFASGAAVALGAVVSNLDTAREKAADFAKYKAERDEERAAVIELENELRDAAPPKAVDGTKAIPGEDGAVEMAAEMLKTYRGTIGEEATIQYALGEMLDETPVWKAWEASSPVHRSGFHAALQRAIGTPVADEGAKDANMTENDRAAAREKFRDKIAEVARGRLSERELDDLTEHAYGDQGSALWSAFEKYLRGDGEESEVLAACVTNQVKLYHGKREDKRRDLMARRTVAPPEPTGRGYEHVAGDVIAKGVLTIVGGAGGVSKSTLMTTMACGLASGVSYVGPRPNGPCRVLSINLEDPSWRVGNLINALAMNWPEGASADALDGRLVALGDDDWPEAMLLGPDEALPVVTPVERVDEDGEPVFTRDIEFNPVMRKRILALIDEAKPEVLIIDPIAVLFAGAEVTNSFANIFARGLARIARERNIAVIAVSHTRKGDGKSTKTAADIKFGGELGDAARCVMMLDGIAEGQAVRKGEDRDTIKHLAVGKINVGQAGQRWFYRLIQQRITVDTSGTQADIQVVVPWSPPRVDDALQVRVAMDVRAYMNENPDVFVYAAGNAGTKEIEGKCIRLKTLVERIAKLEDGSDLMKAIKAKGWIVTVEEKNPHTKSRDVIQRAVPGKQPENSVDGSVDGAST